MLNMAGLSGAVCEVRRISGAVCDVRRMSGAVTLTRPPRKVRLLPPNRRSQQAPLKRAPAGSTAARGCLWTRMASLPEPPRSAAASFAVSSANSNFLPLLLAPAEALGLAARSPRRPRVTVTNASLAHALRLMPLVPNKHTGHTTHTAKPLSRVVCAAPRVYTVRAYI